MHLMKFVKKSCDHGLILSVKTALIAKEHIEFFGLKFDHRGTEMQLHVCEKIINFLDKLVSRK